MKTTLLPCILATLLPCTLVANDCDKDKPYDDGVRVGRFYTIDAYGQTRGHTYISVVDPRDGCGLGVTHGDDGSRGTYLITPDITVETGRSR